MQKETTHISTRHKTQHWLRNSITLLAEVFIWAGCVYVATLLLGLKGETVHPFAWFVHLGRGLVFLVIVSYLIPNNAYNRTTRRDEVVSCAMKTALAVSVLAFAVFTERTSLQFLSCLLFCIALIAERLILNSWFIRYCTQSAHFEHGVLICNEETTWQQQALQQNTYGLKLTRFAETEQTTQQFTEYLAAHPETESVYCVPSALHATELEAIAHLCREQGLVFHLLPQPVYALNKEMQSECRGTISVLSPAKLPLQSFINRLVKRLTDIVLSLLVLLTIFPIFAAFAFFIIKRQSHGPALITRHMCGMNGKTFQCLTFRTRHYESAPSFLDGINDPGYFQFGKFLMRTKFELLPQFLCVLWGNMTIVGSEMMRPEHYTDYRRELKQLFASECNLKAGVTSFHFASQPKGSTKADVWYCRNWSFWLDMRIMFQRFGTLLSKSKAKTINYI